MGILDNCTDLWYLMSDFFHENKCNTGFIDPKDNDYYSFKKKDYIFGIRRLNKTSYKLRVLNISKELDINYQLKTLQEVKDTILKYF